MPCCCCISCTRPQTLSRATGSRPTVGSSSTSSQGRLTSACASSKRRTMPPEYVPAMRSAAPARSTVSRTSSTRALRSRRGTSYSRANQVTFSRPVSALDRELLRDVPDQPPNRHGLLANVEPEHADLAVLHRQQGVEQPDRRRLPCAVRPEQTEAFPRGDGEAEVVD